jgi:hypothetical protein
MSLQLFDSTVGRSFVPTQTLFPPTKVLSRSTPVLDCSPCQTHNDFEEGKKTAREKGNNKEDVEGERKFRAPYKTHHDNKGFNALYEASCYCGRVNYQLSREKPLDAKHARGSIVISYPSCQVMSPL